MRASQFLNKLLSTSKNGTVAIMGHRSPDFDCIGSCVAMHLVLKQLGIQSEVFVENNYDPIFKYNAEGVDFCTSTDKTFDVCIVVDCSSASILPENLLSVYNTAKTTFVIDHHITNTNFAQFNYVKQSSSACEVIFELFKNKITLTPQLAKNLYLGIYTDTGGFKFSNTTSTTFAVLSCLTQQDIQPDKIVHDCVDLVKRNYFELTKCAFNSVKFFEDGKIAVSLLTKHDLEANNVERDTAKFMQFYLQNVEGVKIAVSISEGQKNEFHISLRTACDDVDVSAIAKRFGGGGHVRASGLTLKGELKKALNALLLECKKSLKGQNAN